MQNTSSIDAEITAIDSTKLISLYHQIKIECKRRKLSIPPAPSTKRLALEKMNPDSIDRRVLVFVYNHGQVSRNQIAEGMSERLATITGACNRLLSRKVIQSCGRVKDNKTGYMCELLCVNNLWQGE